MVELMISYFYDLTYSCGNTIDITNNSNDPTAVTSHEDIITHAKMFALAVKYQAKELRHFAKCSFGNAAETAWESDAFLEAAEIVLTSTPEDVTDLRNMVFDTLHQNFSSIMDKPEVKELFCSHPDLSYELMKRKTYHSRYYAEPPESECVVCHQAKGDSDFAPGLPKICMRCNVAPYSWQHSSW